MEGKNLQTEMELALAHEVKNFKLTNNRKQIHLLCDNQLTMAIFLCDKYQPNIKWVFMEEIFQKKC